MKNYNRNRPNFRQFNNQDGPRFKKYDGPKPTGLQVFVRDGEDISKAIRKLKKKVEAAGILKELREREYYTKPSARRREAKKAARARWLRKRKEIENNY